MDFKQALKEKTHSNLPHKDVCVASFVMGATWGHEWASEKGIGNLTKWMKSVKRNQLERNLKEIHRIAGTPRDPAENCRDVIEFCDEVLLALETISES